ncbi:MAG: hypothetical protein ACYCQJ_03225 [Nitrososphaerales archaeon]
MSSPKSSARALICLLLLGMIVLSLANVPVSYAPKASITVAVYLDSLCTTALPSGDDAIAGQTVYAQLTVSGTTSPYSVAYEQVSTVKTTNTISSGASTICDSTGYTIPSTGVAGSWSIVATDSTVHPGAVTGSVSFSVVVPVANTYSSGTCGTQQTSFNSGTPVYGGFTVSSAVSGSFYAEYINPSGSTAKTSGPMTKISSTLYCDPTGCKTSCSTPSSTSWKLQILYDPAPVAPSGSPVNFTILTSTPAFPLGILPVILILPLLFFVLKRKMPKSTKLS